MSGLRAGKAGSNRDVQSRIDAAFDVEDAKKCMYWVAEVIGQRLPIEESNERYKVMENFYKIFRDGFVLCQLISAVSPDQMKLNFKASTFQPAKNIAFESARERERIEVFTKKCQDFGVASANIFQIDCLYERTNLHQVCACIAAIGTEYESQPYFKGTQRWWPKKVEENKRNFSEEQLRAGECVINLQYGTNKGASQAGMNFGKKRMITKE